jgi:diguanylate cyclase (GGDEF)-like protein
MSARVSEPDLVRDQQPHGSVSRRLIAETLLLTLIVSLLVSALQLVYAYNTAMSSAEDRLEEIATSTAPSLEASLWQVDNATVGLLLDGIARLPRVSFVEVVTKEGEHFRRGDSAAAVLIERTYPLRHAGIYELGTLRVVLGRRQLVELLSGQAASIAIATLTALLFSSTLLFLLFRRLVTRHLIAIAGYTRALNLRGLDVPLRLDKKPNVPPDEFDELSRSFNSMRQTLAQELQLRDRDQAELVMHRERLEHLVEARTAELAEKNQLLQEQHDEMQRLARVDSLTGVNNRRHFEELAEREIARSKRQHEPLSLLLLDVDYFKQINDRRGHAVGDLALKQLCQTCLRLLREIDVFSRMGGEEFAILLPSAALTDAALVAERVRSSVADSRLETSDGSPLQFTVSIGISTLGAEDTLGVLLRKSDEALYRAKNQGRNRVCTDGSPIE